MLACAVAVALIAGRIWWVNEQAIKIPVEHVAQGSWLALDGAFAGSDEEQTKGYEFRVEKTEVVTPDEYLSRYGKDGVASTEDGARRSVLAVTLTMRNTSTEGGGIMSFLWEVIPESKNTDYSVDEDLWAHVAKMDPSMFSVPPGKTLKTVVPFVGFSNPPYFGSDEASFRPPIEGSSFELVMSNLPVRKILDLRVDAS